MDLLDGIDVACPACGRRSRYPVVHAGKTVSCPACKHEHLLPGKDASGSHALPPASPTLPPASPAKPTTAPLASKPSDSEKILFVCASCQYRARIPGQYAGMAVRCPSCDAAQIATPDASGGTTGNTVQLSKLPTPGHKTTIRPGNILFICSQCNFEAQLAKHYVGKAIRCPGCHAPQVVAGEPPAKEPAALERNTPATGEAPAPAGDPRFICVGCGYRARIPSQYMGLAVTCPKCDTVQIATPEEQEGPSTGDTVSISRMKTAADGAQIANPQVTVAANEPGIKMPTSKAPPVSPAAPAKNVAPTAAAGGGDKVRFTCSACGFKARIPASYAGENIHCPGCSAVQLVLRSGQMSPNASGNTQILQVVQTAGVAGSPDAIATPTHTPAHGVPVISDPAAKSAPPVAKPAPPQPTKPLAPPVAKPAAPPVAKPAASAQPAAVAVPPAAVPVAQPAGTAKAEASIDDLLNFEEPPAEEPKPAGKVVRRGSDRLSVIASKSTTPPPGKMATPLPSKPSVPPPAKPAAAVSGQGDEEPSGDAQSVNAAQSQDKVAVNADRTRPRTEAKDDMPAAPAKQSNAMVIVVAVIGLGLLGGLGFLMKLQMDNATQMADMTSKINTMSDDLQKARTEVQETNKKLAKAEEDAKIAQEKADLAAQKQAEEAAARKASEEKAAELEAKLKAAEEAAAAAKAAAETPAPTEPPAPVEK